MTLGLDQWLRLLGNFFPGTGVSRAIPRLDLSRMAARDIADLNLPSDVLSRLEARRAGDLRHRGHR